MTLGVLVLGWAAGCEDKHIGRPCLTNAPDDAGASGGQVAIVSSPNLQCPSRICLQPADEFQAAADHTGPFCTDTCSTDDDCSDGETGSKSNPMDTHCKSNFVCAVATTSGPFCCQKYCICHDFVIVPPGGFKTPQACLSPSNSGPNPPTCVNVH